ncbi:ribosomal protein L5 [Neurospora crassa]|uniref:Large ribosomal subunit protein uL5m n=2 Tax=Neurospora crassa TaxID=5141 RepID=RM07_NEUCR|nr:mitochondrial 54S ribosomal protein YmL7/YmL5 [Neurospora crassa OR74A]Q1K6P0.1 RecName: Full=Large ribosomal subunit protein uL5m [Neurospora crassa OR74A]6YWE_E Chain E, Related to ribosomal protein L5, mitochondrial [Neurospora crassa]6YWS_E Chain E, 50S ribosomal protein L5 [Neurospora crassa OR74A]6YWV_E Chain E, 50S ribosomal protein L5 [Neurospora crassa OR74A]6YWX_E Chain E, 50S ribosomal protein L5 [Neurospora crassa OR74A]6YWY_E Chain E, Related to ribosomal protein L5, mitochond|eukprot:XP_960729.1 mitochondrial 54S ribosomal protein YmL7/YmL5 [Neurospora crassa OR74A]
MASLRGVSRSARALQPFSAQFAVRRCASTQTGAGAAAATPKSNIPDLAELETRSALDAPIPSEEDKKEFRPWKRAADRKARLPSSRYQYHPPKYNRGPLHPIQSPPSSDPIARDFVPGPFNMPRLKETFRTVMASDLMTLAYIHTPPGTPKKEPTERLRAWEGDSPYFANRARRAPRGAPELPIRERDISFRNIPEIKEITVSTFVPLGLKNPDLLIVARAVLLAMTGTMPEMTRSKNNVVQWQLQANKPAGCKTTIYGNAAWEFMDRLIHLVLPRIKDWKGVPASTGDGSGNVQFGLNPEDVQLFPEVECNYDMYPAKMIPGCHIAIKTTATSDRQAKLLLQSLGVPFYSN